MSVRQLQEKFERLVGSRRVALIIVLAARLILFLLPFRS
jgi:hypothetical protein